MSGPELPCEWIAIEKGLKWSIDAKKETDTTTLVLHLDTLELFEATKSARSSDTADDYIKDILASLGATNFFPEDYKLDAAQIGNKFSDPPVLLSSSDAGKTANIQVRTDTATLFELIRDARHRWVQGKDEATKNSAFMNLLIINHLRLVAFRHCKTSKIAKSITKEYEDLMDRYSKFNNMK